MVEWSVQQEEGRIRDEGPLVRRGASESVVFLDGVVNAHAHVGDAALAGRDFPRDLEALVRPGTGWKHRELERTPREALVRATAQALRVFHGQGVDEVFDFREQGPAGLLTLREALRQASPAVPRVRALGRPAAVPASEAEVAALWHLADGLGIPGLADWGSEACRDLADAAHKAGKLVALHLSEGRHEPVEEAVALRPHLAVHLCHATASDLRRLADVGVVAVLCPRSNHFFGQACPAEAVERAGLPWLLGTDNAMLGFGDLLGEARFLKQHTPDLPDASLARALTGPPRKGLNQLARLDSESPRRRLLALPRGTDGAVRWEAPPLVLTR